MAEIERIGRGVKIAKAGDDTVKSKSEEIEKLQQKQTDAVTIINKKIGVLSPRIQSAINDPKTEIKKRLVEALVQGNNRDYETILSSAGFGAQTAQDRKEIPKIIRDSSKEMQIESAKWGVETSALAGDQKKVEYYAKELQKIDSLHWKEHYESAMRAALSKGASKSFIESVSRDLGFSDSFINTILTNVANDGSGRIQLEGQNRDIGANMVAAAKATDDYVEGIHADGGEDSKEEKEETPYKKALGKVFKKTKAA